jgi:hypothetical protein
MLHIIREINLSVVTPKAGNMFLVKSPIFWDLHMEARAQYWLRCGSRKVQQGLVAAEFHRLQCHLMKQTIFQERL